MWGNRKYKLIRSEHLIVDELEPDADDYAAPWQDRFYRLQALRDIPEHGVKAGDLGGYVSKTNRRNILSHEGSCWIGPEAMVAGNVFITDDVYIGDKAFVFNSLRGCKLRVSGAVSVTGNAELRKESWTRNDMLVSGSVKISESAVVLNVPSLVGDLEIKGKTFLQGENPMLRSAITGSELVKAIEAPVKSVTTNENNEEAEQALALFDELTGNIASYESDIVKILKYPAMTDRTDPFTREMIKAQANAKRLSAHPDSAKFIKAVAGLEDAFLSAESNALKLASTMLSAEGVKRTKNAKIMLAKASNEASSETEKKVAFTQAFKQLEGVIAVPEVAVETFRVKIGLQEIEA